MYITDERFLPFGFQYRHFLADGFHFSIQELPQRLYETIGGSSYKVPFNLSQSLLALADFY